MDKETAVVVAEKPKSLAQASALFRLLAWSLRSDAPAPVYVLPEPVEGESFKEFARRASIELAEMAQSAQEKSLRQKAWGERGKDLMAAGRSFVAGYPILAAMVGEIVLGVKDRGTERGRLRMDGWAKLESLGWGIAALARLKEHEALHGEIMAARVDANKPLPGGLVVEKAGGKLAMFGNLAKLVAIVGYIGLAVAGAPLMYGALSGRLEPRGRVDALSKLAASLRACSASLAEAGGQPRSVFEALLDARSALAAFGDGRSDGANCSAILSALVLERQERAPNAKFEAIRHPECGWKADEYWRKDRKVERLLVEEENEKVAEESLVVAMLGRKSKFEPASEVAARLADWLRIADPKTYRGWNGGEYVLCAAMCSVDFEVANAMREISSIQDVLDGHFKTGRHKEPDRPVEVHSLRAHRSQRVSLAAKRPISTALDWGRKLVELAREQDWPLDLRAAAAQSVACAGVQLWLCAPDNEEAPVPSDAWVLDRESYEEVRPKMFEAASFALAPLADTLGLGLSDWTTAVGQALEDNGYGGVRLVRHPVVQSAQAEGLCAKGLADAQALALSEATGELGEKASAARRRL